VTELNQGKHAATAALAVLVVAVLSGCGPEKYQAKTGGSDEYMQKYKSGQPLYTPPSDAVRSKGQVITPNGGQMPGSMPAMPTSPPK
jgi:predicted small lipoprotein YifL